jgi:hypothetical protein
MGCKERSEVDNIFLLENFVLRTASWKCFRSDRMTEVTGRSEAIISPCAAVISTLVEKGLPSGRWAKIREHAE